MMEEYELRDKKKIAIACSIAVSCLILMIIGVCVAGYFINKKEKARIYDVCLETGKKYINQYEYEKAEAMLTRAINIDKKAAPAYNELVNVNLNKKNYQAAKEVIEKAKTQVDNKKSLEPQEHMLSQVIERTPEISRIPEVTDNPDSGNKIDKENTTSGSADSDIPEILSARIADFDGDGVCELLTVETLNQEVRFCMYEYDGDEVIASDDAAYYFSQKIFVSEEEFDTFFTVELESGIFICGSVYDGEESESVVLYYKDEVLNMIAADSSEEVNEKFPSTVSALGLSSEFDEDGSWRGYFTLTSEDESELISIQGGKVVDREALIDSGDAKDYDEESETEDSGEKTEKSDGKEESQQMKEKEEKQTASSEQKDKNTSNKIKDQKKDLISKKEKEIEEVSKEVKETFCQYVRENILPDMGFANHNEKTKTLKISDFYNWDERTGIAAVDFIDMNKDDRPEMLLYYLKDNGETGDDYGQDLYMEYYTLKSGVVTRLDEICLCSVSSMYNDDVKIGITEIDDEFCLYVEQMGHGYNTDLIISKYDFYQFKDNEFFLKWQIDKGTDPVGLSCISLYTYDEKEEEMIEDTEYNEEDNASACELYLKKLGFKKFNVRELFNGKYFPTLWDTNQIKKTVHYNCKGKENKSGEYLFKVTLKDQSQVEVKIDKYSEEKIEEPPSEDEEIMDDYDDYYEDEIEDDMEDYMEDDTDYYEEDPDDDMFIMDTE